MVSERLRQSVVSVSLVVPTRDRPESLRRCLQSLAALDPPALEVIVVDDGALVAEELAAFARSLGLEFVYHRKQSPGTSASRNIGARLARGDYILFLDDDVLPEPDYLGRVMRTFAQDPDGRLAGVGGSLIEPDAPRGGPVQRLLGVLQVVFLIRCLRPGRVLPSGFRTHLQQTDTIREVEILSTSNCCYRRDVLERYRFDETLDQAGGYAYGEDVDFSYRVSRDWRLLIIPEARAHHFRAPYRYASRRELARMYLIHHRRFLKKSVGLTPLRALAFGWACFGVLVCDVVALALRPSREKVGSMAGHLDAIGLILRGRADERPAAPVVPAVGCARAETDTE